MRAKIMYKALTRMERAILNLTIKCVEQVRSPTLQNALSSIVSKIKEALENRFLIKAEKIGREKAEKLGNQAQKWGNTKASNWKRDKTFIIYLGVGSLN
jgi:replicative superfamily II helicase